MDTVLNLHFSPIFRAFYDLNPDLFFRVYISGCWTNSDDTNQQQKENYVFYLPSTTSFK